MDTHPIALFACSHHPRENFVQLRQVRVVQFFLLAPCVHVGFDIELDGRPFGFRLVTYVRFDAQSCDVQIFSGTRKIDNFFQYQMAAGRGMRKLVCEGTKSAPTGMDQAVSFLPIFDFEDVGVAQQQLVEMGPWRRLKQLRGFTECVDEAGPPGVELSDFVYI